MIRNEQASRSSEFADHRPRPLMAQPRERSQPRTIVIRHGSAWQSLAFLCLCLLLLAVVLMGHLALRGLDGKNLRGLLVQRRAPRRRTRATAATPS